MASRTREKLIEVARQLFIRKGVDNTTIGDIANASDKGRRTIYTYFKDKREIFRAVLEKDSDRMVQRLRDVCDEDLSPTEKLRKFISVRMAVAREQAAQSRKLLKSLDFGRGDKVRRLALEKENQILREILSEGIQKGDFNPERCHLLANFATTVMNFIDYGLSADETFGATALTESSCVEFIVQSVISLK